MSDQIYSPLSVQIGKIQVLVITFKNDNSLSKLSEVNPTLDIVVVNDFREVLDKPQDKSDWAKDSRMRNKVLTALSLNRFQYILWIDSDIVEYPLDLPTKLITANPYGVSAPLVLEGDTPERYTFHSPEAFIDKSKKNFNKEFPYFPGYSDNRIVNVESVGSCYTIPANIYKNVSYECGFLHTEHYSVCQYVKDKGLPVTVSCGLKVYVKRDKL